MKFGKEFALQMVPEWHEAYINYNELKTLLKKILNIRHNKPLPPHETVAKRETLHKTFSGLTTRYHRRASIAKSEEEVIVVTERGDEGSEDNYHTTFLMVSEEGGHFEHMFFEKLDRDFNKVIKFYKSKEEELIKEAEKLTKQMDALVALRLKVDNFHKGDAVNHNAMHTILEDDEEEEESSEKKPSKAISPVTNGVLSHINLAHNLAYIPYTNLTMLMMLN